jgi:hypothetical protein
MAKDGAIRPLWETGPPGGSSQASGPPQGESSALAWRRLGIELFEQRGSSRVERAQMVRDDGINPPVFVPQQVALPVNLLPRNFATQFF